MSIHPHIQSGIDLSEKNNSMIIEITDNYRQIQTVCPECKTKVCYYSDGIPKEHYCTVCKNLVNLSLGKIPA